MSQGVLPVSSNVHSHGENCAESREQTTGDYRLKIKIGHAEFEGDGPINLVRADYQTFVDLVQNVGMKTIEGQSTPMESDQDLRCEPRIEQNTWERVYLRKDDRLSLNIIPESKTQNSDAILLIIYGYQKLYEQDGVTSVAIMDAAKQSGLRIDRVDRNITSEHSKLVLKGGSGKGSRYSLNNRGDRYVENLLDSLFD